MLSTVFDKKVCFHVSKLKKCRTKSVVSRDFLRLAFNLFQEENGTFFPISFWLLQSVNGIAYDDIRHSRLFYKWNTWRMIIEYPSNIEKYFESFEIINSLCWLPNAYIFSDLKTIACAATGKQVSNRKQSSEKLFADYVKKFSILTYDVSQIYDSTVIHYDYPLFEDLHDVFADLKRHIVEREHSCQTDVEFRKCSAFGEFFSRFEQCSWIWGRKRQIQRKFREWMTCMSKQGIVDETAPCFLADYTKKPGINLTLKISKRLGIQGSNL